jgi:hypothetical protein
MDRVALSARHGCASSRRSPGVPPPRSNPVTAERDLDIVAALARGFGHINMGSTPKLRPAARSASVTGFRRCDKPARHRRFERCLLYIAATSENRSTDVMECQPIDREGAFSAPERQSNTAGLALDTYHTRRRVRVSAE